MNIERVGAALARGAMCVAVATAVCLPGIVVPAEDGSIAAIPFLSAVDDEPIDVSAFIGQPDTPAVATFVRTGRNAYAGDADAMRTGREKYEQWCQLCHLADASGRMGPSLVDEVYHYKRSHTDHGMFEVIYAGAAGAMQPFNERLTPDEILKVIAYIRSLRKP